MHTIDTEATILAERRATALQRLHRRYPQFTASPDPQTGGHIVRNVKVPGRVVLVDRDGQCSCNYGRTFDVCRHIAAVEADTSWHIIEGGR